MIVEYIRYSIPSDQATAFEAAYGVAQVQLMAAPECMGYELSRCVEDQAQYVLRIEWTSAEHHLQGFRKSERFPPFLASIRAYIPYIVEMRHYAPTAVSARTGHRDEVASPPG